MTQLCDKCHYVIAEGDGVWARHQDKGLIFVHETPECTTDVVVLTARELRDLS